jgi:hypothetical protein
MSNNPSDLGMPFSDACRHPAHASRQAGKGSSCPYGSETRACTEAQLKQPGGSAPLPPFQLTNVRMVAAGCHKEHHLACTEHGRDDGDVRQVAPARQLGVVAAQHVALGQPLHLAGPARPKVAHLQPASQPASRSVSQSTRHLQEVAPLAAGGGEEPTPTPRSCLSPTCIKHGGRQDILMQILGHLHRVVIPAHPHPRFAFPLTWKRTASLIAPRCTGRCGALATSDPSGPNKAQLKSSRSLMFTLPNGSLAKEIVFANRSETCPAGREAREALHSNAACAHRPCV